MIDDDISVKNDNLLQQIDDRNDDMIITFNKLLIEIDKFNEDLNIQNAYRNESGENRVDFDRIHLNLFRCNNII